MAGACWVLILSTISCLLGVFAQENVTLESIAIFRTHEWLGHKPSVYFQCRDEQKVNLPDVKEKDHVYGFAGHESWQPLTALAGVKCKRCGVYEENEFLKDGTFDEWEFCPDEFGKDGRYVHFKDGEFNATFLTSTKEAGGSASDSNGKSPVGSRGGNTALTAVVLVFAFLTVAGLGIIAYTKWQQKKREEQQARFIKLFEEDDDFEKELGF